MAIFVNFGLFPLQCEFFKVIEVLDLGNTWETITCVRNNLISGMWEHREVNCGNWAVRGPGRVVEILARDRREILFCTSSRERCSAVWAWGTMEGPPSRFLWGSGKPFFLGDSRLTFHELVVTIAPDCYFFLLIYFFDPHLSFFF